MIYKIFCFTFLFFLATEKSFAKTDFLSLHKNEISQVESYLNGIKNLSAKFVQKTNNSIVEGKFYLSRPGKMRVEYLNEPKILIVVNGAILSYKDLELEEVSNISTNTTPASFLTRQNISFSAKDIEITNVVKNQDLITISIIKKNRTDAGEFSITFKINQQSIEFVKMDVANNLENRASITLKDVNFPEKLEQNLFIIRSKNLPF